MMKTNNKQWSLGFDEKTNKLIDIINSWDHCKEELKRINWDEYFILQAFLVSTRSHDAQTQHGCIFVKNKTIIATGYNGFIKGINDEVLPNLRPEKYPFFIHSEQNALLSCAYNGISCRKATAYITGIPCIQCLQSMYQAGISEMVFPTNYNVAHMIQNEKEENNREILIRLMKNGKFPLKMRGLVLEKTILEKIEIVKSIR